MRIWAHWTARRSSTTQLSGGATVAREIPLLALRSVLLPGETLPLMRTDPANIAIIEAAIAGQEEARRAQQKQQQCEDELCASDSGRTAADTSDEPAAAATFGVVLTRHFRRRVIKLPASVIGHWLINPEEDTCLHAVHEK
jgi:Lon protease-like protein